ncbi:MAG: Crp/Fnr family transcriptional regulator [Saprospiraceae bacterium]
MESFIAYLRQVSPLTPKSCHAFAAKCKTFHFPKGKYLLKSGQTSQYLYFVKTGIGKVFYLKDGKEIIDWISDEGNLLTSVASFLTQTPSVHYVKLIEDAELIGISYTDLERLFAEHHELERLGRKLTIMALVQLQNRINSMQFESAKKRYEDFLDRYPNCINRISLGDLASFLGMTQVTLSRVRAMK